MKSLIKTLALAAVIISCSSPKAEEEEEEPIEVVADTTRIEESPMRPIEVEGKVKEITMGKDGYTAQIVTGKDEVYFLTISIPNMKDPKQYKTVKPGETVKVKGDAWMLEQDNYITVRELN